MRPEDCTREMHIACKIDCLLKAHNELIDRHNALIDRAVAFIDQVIAITTCAADYMIDFQLKLLQEILTEGKVGVDEAGE